MNKHDRYNRSEEGRERYLRYWHKPYGGYYRRRKSDLASQREDATQRLAELSAMADQLWQA